MGIVVYFLFLKVLRCFSSLRSPRPPMDSVDDDPLDAGRVSPFGNLRVSGCLLLTEDYRRRTASFIGSVYQGIHHGLLVFFPARLTLFRALPCMLLTLRCPRCTLIGEVYSLRDRRA